MLTKIFGSLLVAIITFSEIYAQQTDSLKIVELPLLREDFRIFRNSLQQTYPSLYRFKEKKTIDHLFDSCYSTLNQLTTQTKFFTLIKLLLSAVEDGHLYCGPSPEFKRYYDKIAKVFPLQLRFIGEKAYVVCSNKESLPAGTQILSIHDVPIDYIRKDLFRYIVSDGGIQTKKYWTLNANFWFYYIMINGQQPVFNIKYKEKNGQIITKTLSAVVKDDIDCRHTVEQEVYLRLSYDETNKIALLTIKTFNQDELTRSNEIFATFLQSVFKELKNNHTDKLIIDLRGNGGGIDDYGSLLYSYLTNNEFQYYTSLETSTQKITKGTPNSLIQSGSVDNFKGRTNLQTQRPSENNFKGRVYFLIDGLSFSTTSEFCAIAKSNNRGKFIGEETGGGYYGNTSGNYITTILPNTNITVSLSTTKYVMTVKKCKYSDRGILPDYAVIPGINDVIENKDVQLNFALKLAARE